RIPQHQAVVDAAKEAGVGLVVYTSAPKADTSDMVLAEEHRATEQALMPPGCRTSSCATAGTWRTTPAGCRWCWSTA
ncbi:MAG TPA: hypothetical protein VG268_06240, partial [Streptosporangiaceae bacterium]|nr:hypothetical protein [Streptosporangiaceae bacterium]